jgi:hypothetical protein
MNKYVKLFLLGNIDDTYLFARKSTFDFKLPHKSWPVRLNTAFLELPSRLEIAETHEKSYLIH